jgi:hypothetical protein
VLGGFSFVCRDTEKFFPTFRSIGGWLSLWDSLKMGSLRKWFFYDKKFVITKNYNVFI